MTPDADLSAELAEARRGLAELETVDAERRHAEKVQSALYQIAALASAAQDMQEFYRSVSAARPQVARLPPPMTLRRIADGARACRDHLHPHGVHERDEPMIAAALGWGDVAPRKSAF